MEDINVFEVVTEVYSDDSNFINKGTISKVVYIKGRIVGWIYPDGYYEINEEYANGSITDEFMRVCDNLGLEIYLY